MGSLITTCEIIDKIPAWPWERETVVTFVSVFLLPIIVRLIVGIVDQLGLFNQLLPF
jgi:preprotein translocase subunit SecE